MKGLLQFMGLLLKDGNENYSFKKRTLKVILKVSFHPIVQNRPEQSTK